MSEPQICTNLACRYFGQKRCRCYPWMRGVKWIDHPFVDFALLIAVLMILMSASGCQMPLRTGVTHTTEAVQVWPK